MNLAILIVILPKFAYLPKYWQPFAIFVVMSFSGHECQPPHPFCLGESPVHLLCFTCKLQLL